MCNDNGGEIPSPTKREGSTSNAMADYGTKSIGMTCGHHRFNRTLTEFIGGWGY